MKEEYNGAEYPDPFIIAISPYLKDGSNTLSFELISFAKPGAEDFEDNPTGLIYRFHLEYQE